MRRVYSEKNGKSESLSKSTETSLGGGGLTDLSQKLFPLLEPYSQIVHLPRFVELYPPSLVAFVVALFRGYGDCIRFLLHLSEGMGYAADCDNGRKSKVQQCEREIGRHTWYDLGEAE